MLRRSLPLLAFVLGVAPFVVEGCSSDGSSSAASVAPVASGDAGPSTSDAASKAASPCAAGRTRWVTLTSGASGGDLVAFADCIDAGTLPPVAKEGDCQLDPAGVFEAARATRTYVEHGVVRAEQASSGLSVEVATGDVKATFSSKLAAAQPVHVTLGESAAHDREAIDVVAPTAVAFAVGAGASRAQGIALSWQGGKAGERLELVLRASPNGDGRAIRCSADAGTGHLTVAPSLLADFPNGEVPLEVVTETKGAGADGSTIVWVRAAARATGAATVLF